MSKIVAYQHTKPALRIIYPTARHDRQGMVFRYAQKARSQGFGERSSCFFIKIEKIFLPVRNLVLKIDAQVTSIILKPAVYEFKINNRYYNSRLSFDYYIV